MTFVTQVPAIDLPVRNWANRTELHRAIMALFPQSLPGDADARRAQSQILFRVEKLSRGKVVLISSAIAPSVSTPGMQTREVPEQRFEAGQQVRFRVAVNAVRRKTEGKKRVATPAEDVSQWLSERFAGALSEVQPLTHVNEVGFILQGKTRVPLQVDSLDGVAVIADPAALNTLIHAGVGRAKAFGCGLLSVVG